MDNNLEEMLHRMNDLVQGETKTVRVDIGIFRDWIKTLQTIKMAEEQESELCPICNHGTFNDDVCSKCYTRASNLIILLNKKKEHLQSKENNITDFN